MKIPASIWLMFFVAAQCFSSASEALGQAQADTVSFKFGDEACMFPPAASHPSSVAVSPFMREGVGCHAGGGHLSRLWTTAGTVNPAQYLGFNVIATEGGLPHFSTADSIYILAESHGPMRLRTEMITSDTMLVLGDTLISSELTAYAFPFPFSTNTPFSADSIEFKLYGYGAPGANAILTIQEILTTFEVVFPTGFEEVPEIFSTPSISAYPNPVTQGATLALDLKGAGKVQLVVYDILGRKIDTLVDRWLPVGRYEVEWDASGFAEGIYLYRLETGAASIAGKMVVVR